MISLPFLLSLLIGFLFIQLIFPQNKSCSFFLKLIFGWGLGLGLSSCLTFSSFLIFNQFQPGWIIFVHLFILVILLCMLIFNKANCSWPTVSLPELLPTGITVTGFLIMLWLVYQSAMFYPRGGWDAWQVWNFKARFLFLAGENWQNLFDPLLWRSSPHYPLLLPMINVWAWILPGTADATGPRITAILFTMLTAGLLSASLVDKTKNPFSALAGILMLSLPFFTLIATSQYCDIVLSFYLLAAVVCLIQALNQNEKGWAILAGLMTGFLGFTKPEGLIAAILILGIAILCVLISWLKKDKSFPATEFGLMFLSFIFISLTTFAFHVLYSPGNQTFINGITSTVKPADTARWQIILLGFVGEFMSKKWNGIWFMVLFGILLGGKNNFKKSNLLVGLLLLSYLGVILAYYYINTYFEIRWWLTVTLNRILVSLLPLALYWIFSTVLGTKNPK